MVIKTHVVPSGDPDVGSEDGEATRSICQGPGALLSLERALSHFLLHVTHGVVAAVLTPV